MAFDSTTTLVGGTVELGHVLGSGGFGKVYLGYDRKRKINVAVKVINKNLVKLHDWQPYIEREIEVMRKINHKHVVKLLDVFESTNSYNIVMELAPNGELFDKIVTSERFNENTARLYFQQLICAVHYCHGLNIVHRDLKAENLLLGKNNELKICDWGLSRYTKETCFINKHNDDNDNDNDEEDNDNDIYCDILFRSLAGSIDYQAPEVLSGKGYTGNACDMWSCGSILFFMLCGYLPFTDVTDVQTKRRILNCQYNKKNRYLSSLASDLISHLLEVNPQLRYTTTEVIGHPWFQIDLDPNLIPNIQLFNNNNSGCSNNELKISSPFNNNNNNNIYNNNNNNSSNEFSLSFCNAKGLNEESLSPTLDLLQEIHKAFVTCNVNGSGFLNQEEVRDALIKLNNQQPVSEEEVKNFMSNFTLDKDKCISEEEFVIGWTTNQNVGKKYDLSRMANLFHYDLETEYLLEVRRAFDSIDVNHTGLITPESLQKLDLYCSKAEILRFFNTIDQEVPNNGTLSFEQFVYLCSRYDVFKNHPTTRRLRRLEKFFNVTDIRSLKSYLGTGFTVAGSRENIVLRIRSQEAVLSTKFEGNRGGLLYGTYSQSGKKILEVGICLHATVTGYTKVVPYRIAGKTKDFHQWFLALRRVLRAEILRCEEDTAVKGTPELV